MNNGFSMYFVDNNFKLFLNNVYFGCGYLSDSFIVINLDCNNSSFSFVTSTSNAQEVDSQLWHARLSHIGKDRLDRLAKTGLLGELSRIDLPICEHCLQGKLTRKPFGKTTRANFPLQLVHSDVCGPMNVKARHGASYFITFIDDYTRYGFVYPIKHKSDALECFKRFMILVENQLDKKIKALRTDRGREYLSDEFNALCDEKGIEHQLTMPRTPQQTVLRNAEIELSLRWLDR